MAGRLSHGIAALSLGAGGVGAPGLLETSPHPDIPDRAFVAYYTAASNAPCPLDWRYLAAVGRTETGHGSSQGGRSLDDGSVVKADGTPITSPAGALGPMQFMPATWGQYGAGDYNDLDDASAAAARLLCANGIDTQPEEALGGYNGGGGWRQYGESRAYVDLTTAYAAELPALGNGKVPPHALAEARRIDDGSLGYKADVVAGEAMERWAWLGARVGTTPFLSDAWSRVDSLIRGAPQATPATVAAEPCSGSWYRCHSATAREWRWPCPGPVTSGFGHRTPPVAGARAEHPGVDLGCADGSPVGAVRAGRVGHTGPAGGFGNQVVVLHDGGDESSYNHLGAITVETGDVVDQGTVVGTVGSTGVSTGPHLHLEIWQGGRAVDPVTLLPPR